MEEKAFLCLKNKKEIFNEFFSVNITSPQQYREIKNLQGLTFEKEKNIKMIELTQNTDDHVQIIDSLFFKKGCKVQKL